MKKRPLNLIVSRFIIFFLGAVIAFNFYYSYFIVPSMDYHKCLENFKLLFISIELSQTLFITFMALVVYRLRLCLSNKLAVGGLYFMNFTNIIGLTTSIHFEFYFSILTQVSMLGVFIISILYLLKKKT